MSWTTSYGSQVSGAFDIFSAIFDRNKSLVSYILQFALSIHSVSIVSFMVMAFHHKAIKAIPVVTLPKPTCSKREEASFVDTCKFVWGNGAVSRTLASVIWLGWVSNLTERNEDCNNGRDFKHAIGPEKSREWSEDSLVRVFIIYLLGCPMSMGFSINHESKGRREGVQPKNFSQGPTEH